MPALAQTPTAPTAAAFALAVAVFLASAQVAAQPALKADAFAGGKPVALVIGNAAYPTGALVNPVRDANLIAKRLRGAGYDVRLATDLKRAELLDAVSKFANAAPKGGTAVFFYAGHGIAIRGRNHLLGIDFDAASEDDAAERAYPLDHLLRVLDRRGVGMKVIILDACRNDPFSRSWSRSAASRGFERIRVPRGTYLAYAAAPGEVAADGSGRNSPFTAALAKFMLSKLPLETVFRRVKREVLDATGAKQEPYTENNLTVDSFYLVQQGDAANSLSVSAPPPVVPVPEPAAEVRHEERPFGGTGIVAGGDASPAWRAARERLRRFQFDEASAAFSAVARDSKSLVLNAAAVSEVIRIAMLRGKWQDAVRLCEGWLTSHGKDARFALENADIAWARQEAFGRLGDGKRRARALRDFINSYGEAARDTHRLFAARRELGRQLQADGQTRGARQVWQETVAAFAAGNFTKDGGAAASAAAEAAFRLLEPDYQRVMAMRLVLRKRRDPSKSMADLQQQVRRIIGAINGQPGTKVDAATGEMVEVRVGGLYDRYYNEVAAYGARDWSYAAFLHRGQLLEHFAKTIYDAPSPTDLSPDEEEAYYEVLEQIGSQYESRALQDLEAAVKDADAKGAVGEWVTALREAINRYKPAEYPLRKIAPTPVLEDALFWPPGFAESCRAKSGPCSPLTPGETGSVGWQAARAFVTDGSGAARALVERALRASPTAPDLLLARARVLDGMGLIAAAEVGVLAVIDAQPDNAEALGILGRLYRRRGSRDLATVAFERALVAAAPRPALKGRPSHVADIAAQVHREWALMTLEAASDTAALALAHHHLAEALQLDATSTVGLNNLAVVLVRSRRKEPDWPKPLAAALGPAARDAATLPADFLLNLGNLERAAGHDRATVHAWYARAGARAPERNLAKCAIGVLLLEGGTGIPTEAGGDGVYATSLERFDAARRLLEACKADAGRERSLGGIHVGAYLGEATNMWRIARDQEMAEAEVRAAEAAATAASERAPEAEKAETSPDERHQGGK